RSHCSYMCGICGCWCTYQKQLYFDRHIRKHKDNAKSFRIQTIEQGININDINEYKLKLKLEAKLNTERPYNNNQNNNQSPATLIGPHNFNKPFPCTRKNCDRRFGTQSELNLHSKTHNR